MQFTFIGNPENRRCQYFIAAVKSQGFAAPFVVSYLDLLQQKVDLPKILLKTDYLRIDSPGENFDVFRQFLSLGAKHPQLGNATTISTQAAQQLPFDKGQIQFIRQHHLGFLVFLEQLQQQIELHPRLKLINGIKDIQLMFDKTACHKHFMQHNISVVPAIYNIKSYEDLRSQMAQKKWTRVFIKPIHGSSASGVIAYRVKGNKEQAITSVELDRSKEKLYNSLKIRTYTNNKDIIFLINTLAKEGLIVEQWIPKASLEKGVFDLRMVVINGKAQHTVVRQSQSPMTNLHLGNQRGILEEVKTFIGKPKWEALCQLAEQTVACLPQTFYAGLDIMLSNTLKKSYILEANAFGDLLPNVLIDDMDTYTSTVFNIKNRL